MATDYISRDYAVENMETFPWDTEHDKNAAIHLVRELVHTADVRPVVHGHYIGEYDGYADGNPVCDMWYCSECGCFFEDWDERPTYNFCPNCGADMKENENAEEEA